MGKNKPRHNPDKRQNLYGKKRCPYDDGTKYKECGCPWSDKCDGDQHKCYKLKMQHLASLSQKEKEKYIRRNPENF